MLPRVSPRSLLAQLHDVAAAAATWALAYWLRFNFDIPPVHQHELLRTMLWVAPLQGVIFSFCGLYRGLWRYASMHDAKRIAFGVLIAACAVPVVLQFLQDETVVPRSVLLLQPILLIAAMGGSRLAYRAWKEHKLYGALRAQGKPVLVFGAGEAASMLVKELERSDDWRVVGLLDDNAGKRGHQLQGVRVLGPTEQLARWAHEYAAKHAIIAMPSASHEARRRIFELCSAAGVAVLTVPTIQDLVSGKVTVSQVRRVEVEDLLGREPVVLESDGLRDLISDRVVLVTGAGGSIGSELCRQIAVWKPAQLILFDLSEFALYRIEQEFSERAAPIAVLPVIGDVKDAALVGAIMRKHRPSLVIHAAAYKHVPLMENVNAWQAVRNNTFGTLVVARAAAEHGVAKCVLVSTDKAVNPTNVMGASKRLAEMVCQGLQTPAGTKFEMVRFGNVLASAGSVIPKFHQQIARGGPVTVTHPEIVRYFMSIPEAACLVLQAAALGAGGEIFVLDMGKAVRIVDLARDMIRLSGFDTDEIKIVFTGLRPGEKLYEELLADDERTVPTRHPKVRVAKARLADRTFVDEVAAWLAQGRILEDHEVRQALQRWVPEYHADARPKLQVVPTSTTGTDGMAG